VTPGGETVRVRGVTSSARVRAPDPAQRAPQQTEPSPAAEPPQPTGASPRLLGWTRAPLLTVASVPVAPADDESEREADRVAGRVLAGGPTTSVSPRPSDGGVRRRAAADVTSQDLAPSELPDDGARAIPDPARRRIEPVVGADLGHVRVHSGAASGRMADRLGARAFSYGQRIWLGRGVAPGDIGTLAHEVAHVVQSGRRPGTGGTPIRRQPVTPRPAPADWPRFEDAFRDPNMIAHQKAMDELAVLGQPRAFDLIKARLADKWDRNYAMESALVFFLFFPDVALSRLEDASSAAGADSITALNGLLAHRAMARGPAADVAYRKLDDWITARDIKAGGALTRALQRRQIRTTLERMRSEVGGSHRFTLVQLPGAVAFVRDMDQLIAGLDTLADPDVAALHGKVMTAAAVVTRVEQRIEQLLDRISSLLLQHAAWDSDEMAFIREDLIRRYDDALGKGKDLTGLVSAAATADDAYRNRAGLYQARKIKGLRAGWAAIKDPVTMYPVKNTSGLRAGAQILWAKYDEHRTNLTPRITDLFSRHEGGEQLPVADMATVQRDLLTLQVEQSALSDFFSMFLLYEELARIEPKGASSHLLSDFDDIKADAKRYAGIINGAMTAGDLQPYVRLTEDVDFRIIFQRAKNRAETIEDQQLALEIGLLAASFLAGFGVGLLARGGTALAFGLEAVEAGTLGARVLAGAEFVGNVAAFTLSSEALNSAAFGTKFDVGSLPGKLVENAVMFGAFGALGRLTAGLGKGASGPLMEVLGFTARHGVNLTLFTGVGALGQLVFHGQLPQDWKRFMVQSVASYVLLSALGAAVEPMRRTLDAKTLGPVLQKRLATLDARQEALGRLIEDMTGARSPSGEATLGKADAEKLRKQINDLLGDYRKLLDFLKSSGAVTAAEAAQLDGALAASEKAMTDAVLSSERARIIDLDRLPDLRPAGDGINYTFQARLRGGKGRRSRRATGLDRALRAFADAGYDVWVDSESGVITVRRAGLGDVVARFTPDVGDIPDASAATGKGPRTAKEVTEFLRASGFEEFEIVSFGGADASRLGSRSAARVGRLAEKFTVADLKALARVLWKYDVVLTDRMVDQLLRYVETGRMEEFLNSREAAADSAAAEGLDVDFEQSLGMSTEETNVRKPRTPKESLGAPPWRLAEKHTGAALEQRFGPGWVPGRRFYAPAAGAGETLGSSVPEYYRESTNTAVEVKRFNLAELGIDPAHPLSRGTPSQRSVDALQRARRQIATRRWVLPGKQAGVAPAENWLVFDIRAQGVTDVAATGSGLKSLLGEYGISYDKVMLLTEGGLVDVP